MAQPTNWQQQCSELKQRGAYLFRTKLWTDISFQFGTQNKVYIKGHKLIMAMASPVFGRMFYGGVYELPVPISDVPPDAFEVLMEYFYSDNLNIKSFDIAFHLYYAAIKYRVPYVMKECVGYISHNLGPSNVCRIYEMDCWPEDSPVKDACEQVFIAHTKEIISDASFLEADLNTVVKVFSLEILNIDSELDLFQAAVKYAGAQDKKRVEVEKELEKIWLGEEDIFQEDETGSHDSGASPCKRPRLDSPGTQATCRTPVSSQEGNSTENQHAEHLVSNYSPGGSTTISNDTVRDDLDKVKYRRIVQQIRFRTLTPLEFAECNHLFQLLTESEALALSMNISSKDTPLQMPKGFSKSMVPRNLSTKQDRERRTGSFYSTVPNFRNLRKYQSTPFYVMNLAWTVMLVHECSDDDSLVIGVTCFFESGVPPWIDNVKVKVKFYSDKTLEQKAPKTYLQNMRITSDDPCPEYGTWATNWQWSKITNPDYGLINENTVRYKVDIEVTVPDETTPTTPTYTVRESSDTKSGRPSLVVSIPLTKKDNAQSSLRMHDYSHPPPILRPGTLFYTPSSHVSGTNRPDTRFHTPSSPVSGTNRPDTPFYTPSSSVSGTNRPDTPYYTPSSSVSGTNRPDTPFYTPSSSVSGTNRPDTPFYTPSSSVSGTNKPGTTCFKPPSMSIPPVTEHSMSPSSQTVHQNTPSQITMKTNGQSSAMTLNTIAKTSAVAHLPAASSKPVPESSMPGIINAQSSAVVSKGITQSPAISTKSNELPSIAATARTQVALKDTAQSLSSTSKTFAELSAIRTKAPSTSGIAELSAMVFKNIAQSSPSISQSQSAVLSSKNIVPPSAITSKIIAPPISIQSFAQLPPMDALTKKALLAYSLRYTYEATTMTGLPAVELCNLFVSRHTDYHTFRARMMQMDKETRSFAFATNVRNYAREIVKANAHVRPSPMLGNINVPTSVLPCTNTPTSAIAGENVLTSTMAKRVGITTPSMLSTTVTHALSIEEMRMSTSAQALKPTHTLPTSAHAVKPSAGHTTSLPSTTHTHAPLSITDTNKSTSAQALKPIAHMLPVARDTKASISTRTTSVNEPTSAHAVKPTAGHTPSLPSTTHTHAPLSIKDTNKSTSAQALKPIAHMLPVTGDTKASISTRTTSVNEPTSAHAIKSSSGHTPSLPCTTHTHAPLSITDTNMSTSAQALKPIAHMLPVTGDTKASISTRTTSVNEPTSAHAVKSSTENNNVPKTTLTDQAKQCPLVVANVFTSIHDAKLIALPSVDENTNIPTSALTEDRNAHRLSMTINNDVTDAVCHTIPSSPLAGNDVDDVHTSKPDIVSNIHDKMYCMLEDINNTAIKIQRKYNLDVLKLIPKPKIRASKVVKNRRIAPTQYCSAKLYCMLKDINNKIIDIQRKYNFGVLKDIPNPKLRAAKKNVHLLTRAVKSPGTFDSSGESAPVQCSDKFYCIIKDINNTIIKIIRKHDAAVVNHSANPKIMASKLKACLLPQTVKSEYLYNVMSSSPASTSDMSVVKKTRQSPSPLAVKDNPEDQYIIPHSSTFGPVPSRTVVDSGSSVTNPPSLKDIAKREVAVCLGISCVDWFSFMRDTLRSDNPHSHKDIARKEVTKFFGTGLLGQSSTSACPAGEAMTSDAIVTESRHAVNNPSSLMDICRIKVSGFSSPDLEPVVQLTAPTSDSSIRIITDLCGPSVLSDSPMTLEDIARNKVVDCIEIFDPPGQFSPDCNSCPPEQTRTSSSSSVLKDSGLSVNESLTLTTISPQQKKIVKGRRIAPKGRRIAPTQYSSTKLYCMLKDITNKMIPIKRKYNSGVLMDIPNPKLRAANKNLLTRVVKGPKTWIKASNETNLIPQTIKNSEYLPHVISSSPASTSDQSLALKDSGLSVNNSLTSTELVQIENMDTSDIFAAPEEPMTAFSSLVLNNPLNLKDIARIEAVDRLAATEEPMTTLGSSVLNNPLNLKNIARIEAVDRLAATEAPMTTLGSSVLNNPLNLKDIARIEAVDRLAATEEPMTTLGSSVLNNPLNLKDIARIEAVDKLAATEEPMTTLGSSVLNNPLNLKDIARIEVVDRLRISDFSWSVFELRETTSPLGSTEQPVSAFEQPEHFEISTEIRIHGVYNPGTLREIACNFIVDYFNASGPQKQFALSSTSGLRNSACSLNNPPNLQAIAYIDVVNRLFSDIS